MMKDDERKETLENLEKNKTDFNNQLEKLPVSLRTMALRKRKKEMEDRLAEIDLAIAMFSKKTVYVALD